MGLEGLRSGRSGGIGRGSQSQRYRLLRGVKHRAARAGCASSPSGELHFAGEGGARRLWLDRRSWAILRFLAAASE